MHTELIYVLTGEECANKLGARYIAEFTKRNSWNTGRRKRIWAKHTKDIPKDIYDNIMAKCRYWYSHGLPKEYRIDAEMLGYWQKILKACAEYDCI